MRVLRVGLALLAAALLGFEAARADLTLALLGLQTRIVRLAPDVTAGNVTFLVDDCQTVQLEVTSTSPTLSVQIVGPLGQLVTPSTIGSFGGTYDAGEGASGNELLLLPWFGPGYHYTYSLPSLGPGSYEVQLSSSPAPGGETPVIVDLLTDSSVVANLFVTDEAPTVGGTVVVSSAVFDGSAPVAGAQVHGYLHPPSSAPIPITLLDDGNGPDASAGDGLYSASFTAATSGTFAASATVEGITASGHAFSRTVGTTFDVVPVRAHLTGSLHDMGLDDDADGYPDRVAILADVNVIEPGEYGLFVTLRTALGAEVQGAGRAVLAQGPQSLAASVGAAALIATGEDGPYTVTELELVRYTPAEAVSCDRMDGLAYTTAAYLLSQLQGMGLRLTGAISETATDSDADTDIDVLAVGVGIVVGAPGTYDYAARLVDRCGATIELVSGQQAFPSGASPEALVLPFHGTVIGHHGVDAPFSILDLYLSGPAGSLSARQVGPTAFRPASSFDGYAAAPDCDGDGTPNACEIASGDARDCNTNELPDSCDIGSQTSADCDADGVPDECEPAGVYPPPSVPKDACADSQPVCPGTYVGTTKNSTGDGGSNCNFTTIPKDVWYSYRPRQNGTLTLSLCGTPYRTSLSLHTDCPGAIANEVSCAEGRCPENTLSAPVVVGTTYYIRIAGSTGNTGPFNLSVDGPGCNLNDCNDNGRMDACDTATDCDGNGVPDTCQTDCNANDVADVCDLTSGTSADCNQNAVPDECDTAHGTSGDCNGDTVPDECEPDCNGNHVPDPCDLISGTSMDCDANAVPDDCEPDCNGNGIADPCDLGPGGGSADCDADGRPDECQYASQPPPPSTAQDDCGSAQAICPGVIYTGNTESFTPDGFADCADDVTVPDVWYRYTPAASGTAEVSLCGSEYDTLLAVYPGCPGTPETVITCNDDECDLQSVVSFEVTAGTPYLIRVAGYSDYSGAFTLSLTGPRCIDVGDCNGNGALDACDLSSGAAQDCNADARPDSCDIAAGTSSDCDANGVPDECLAALTLHVERGAGGAAHLAWTAPPAATQFDVVRGDLGLLRASGGSYGTATDACLAEDGSSTSFDDAVNPASGNAFWYLVRGGNCTHPGSYDSAAPARQAPRDPGIAASPAACN